MPALDIPSPAKARNDSTTSTISPLQMPPGAVPAPSPQQPAVEQKPPQTPYAGSGQPSSYAPDSPPRPPVSPITPVATIAQLAPTDPADRVVPPPAVEFIAQPPSKPFSESENTDAIALRSAIALLQIQRDKSKRDIQTLEKIKNAAVAEPEAFVEELKSGRLRPKHAKNDLLGPTLNGSLDSDSDDEARSPRTAAPPPPRFGPVPEPQNVFRCPPINWAKYHVVGESLDKLHAEQQKRPSSGAPGQARAPVHVMAAPYSPFTDHIGSQQPVHAQTRRTSKKPG
ncbi:hypothetical protein DIS24_g2905 [Lasiodiplodia hormozganensis]|uniref:Uncharacterized protein n=2 Tax=Lasiodiplodia TaxID=66739 RepID=A0A5N5DJG2_9PEZI|nr:uncharacterized protein LTHEOB_11654 [Lasiodiplodia theobromae]KAB2577877.1 hypothetical protein DBV05_g3507 [Lasiodiplodia theobromae]KAF4537105.1 hypothetical protein LTHEOB_11654 [Lasiodiplodia theobromae]KAK0660913.1 hypothetical protein DIS24_g2905 [Lasiodiplodia hormozganensis]